MTIIEKINAEQNREYKTMNYYKTYYERYLHCMDDNLRKASREHWIKCHKKNVDSGREDMIIFSGSILAMIALADHEMEENKK